MPKTCKVPNCEKPSESLIGLCQEHYDWHRRTSTSVVYIDWSKARKEPAPKPTAVPPPAKPGYEYSRQLTREPLAYDPPTLPSLWQDLDEATKRLDQAKRDHDQGKLVGYEAFVELTVAASHFARAQQKIILERMIAEREVTKSKKTLAEAQLEEMIAAWSPDGWSI